MNLTLFDEYDLRARISVWIILIAPVIIPLYIISNSVRSLSATALILITLIALSNLFIVKIREIAKDKYDIKHEYIKIYFNQHLSKEALNIILKKIESINCDLARILEDRNSDKYDEALDIVLAIIKKDVRDNKLVYGENIQYGFCRNLYSVRLFGRCMSFIMVFVEVLLYYNDVIDEISTIVSVLISALFFILWFVFVKKNIVEFSANNYAEAFFDAFI